MKKLLRYWMLIQNYFRRAWQWTISHTWVPLMYATFGTWYNTHIYKKYCIKADKLTQRLNWMRVYIFPMPDGKRGLRLVTSSMIAEENKHRSKKRKMDILILMQHSYGWADRNTSALENFYRGKSGQRSQKKADKIKRKAIELRKIPVNDFKRTAS